MGQLACQLIPRDIQEVQVGMDTEHLGDVAGELVLVQSHTE